MVLTGDRDFADPHARLPGSRTEPLGRENRLEAHGYDDIRARREQEGTARAYQTQGQRSLPAHGRPPAECGTSTEGVDMPDEGHRHEIPGARRTGRTGTGVGLVAAGLASLLAATAAAFASPAAAAAPSSTSSASASPHCPAGARAIIEDAYSVNGGAFVGSSNRHIPGLVQSATVVARFRVADGCTDIRVSFVAYTAVAATFTPENATQQRVFDADSQRFSAGVHTLAITLPPCFFQVDLARGAVIEQLGPPGTNNYYDEQNRLVAFNSGGTDVCPQATPSPTPSPSVSASPTPSPSVSATPTPSPSVSATPTPTPSASVLPTAVTSSPPAVQPTSVSSPSVVLGEKVTRGPAVLPFTGTRDVWLLTLVGLALLLGGAGMVCAGVRR